RVAVLVGTLAFAVVDATFVFANSLKIAEGGWLTLAVAVLVMVIFTTWTKGRRLGLAAAAENWIPVKPFVTSLALHLPRRVERTGVFLNADAQFVPHALLHNLKHNQVLHLPAILLVV